VFENKTALFDYVQDIRYGQTDDLRELCFGLTFLKTSEKNYNISFHFYDSNIVNKIKEIPNTLIPAIDPFKTGPDMESYDKWINSGYLQFQQILNEMILEDLITNNKGNSGDSRTAELSFGIIPEKYSVVYFDKIADFIGALLSFFIIIAYLCPLCIIVFRIVQEKESKAKEGMKIMGLNSSIYFLSYFIYWIIQNTVYSLINALILTKLLKYVQVYFIFIFFWLYGMAIFSFAYFLQAIMKKTRVAIIMTVLLYFTMYFISAAVLQQDIKQSSKILLSIMPPTCLGFGLFTLTKFDSNQVNFTLEKLNVLYNNYSVGNMYAMLAFNFILYLILGFYLENVLPQEFGIQKPWYFVCQKSFWCRKSKKKVVDLPINFKENKKNTTIVKENKSSFEKFNYDNITKNYLGKDVISQDFDENESKSLCVNLLGMSKQNENDLEKFRSSKLSKDNQNFRKSSDDNINQNFQSEEMYSSKISSGDFLQIKNLKKEFEDGKIAVDDLNLNIYNNEIFALLGHNGAGKSTTISILTGLYEATSGEAIYCGDNILEPNNMTDFRRKLGICPQTDVLFNDLTVQEHLEMFSIFKGIEKEKIQNEVEKILADIYFESKRDTLAKFLSGGEKRKLSIAIALIGGSQIVFLDEPTSGMDITSRRNLWEILKKCSNDRIIVLTTHYMEEAAVLGNRIGIMSNGKLKCSGNALFLIDKFGKYISLNIFKKEKAVDDNIINFVKEILRNTIPSFTKDNLLNEIDIEILSEEILIRIPKTNDFCFQKFFEILDKNLEKYKIKTYEASMPSLEDVFLNVSAETNKKLNISTDQNDIKQVNSEELNTHNKINPTVLGQILALIHKRFINLIRDKKSFILEIIVPFILVLVGLLISSIQFFVDSPKIDNSINEFPLPQKFIVGKNILLSNKTIDDYFLDSKDLNIELIESYDNQVMSDLKQNLINQNNYLFNLNNSSNLISNKEIINESFFNQKDILKRQKYHNYNNVSKDIKLQINKDKNIFSNLIDGFSSFHSEYKSDQNLGSYAFLDFNKQENKYKFILFVNTNARFSPVIFSQYIQSKIISYVLNSEVTINSSTEPFPLTAQVKNQGQARNISNLVFFVSIAFALIPANFITFLIREKLLNTKHLQLLSGVSKFNYWLSNFIFELIKYYIIAGSISIVIYLFDDYVKYFWIFYVLYGPAMIMFTYMLSFLFETESSGQNGVILLNFLLGTLAGNVVLVFRVLPDFVNTGKLLANLFRIVPSFALTYGYSQLLLSDLLILVDKNFKPDVTMINLDYAGMDVVFLGVCFGISLIVLILMEADFGFKKRKEKNERINSIKNDGMIDSNKKSSNNNSSKDADKSVNCIEEDKNYDDIASQISYITNKDDIEKNDFKNINKIKSYDEPRSVIVEDLVKKYYSGGTLGLCKTEFNAVKKLSFDLKFGECFALLGTTGAGKSSTFKCLTAEITKDSGFISINGIEINNNINQVKNLIGYCPQKDAIFEYMTVYENLDFYARIKGIDYVHREDVVGNLIKEMNLQNYKNKISGNLSGGNKRKLSVAISLVGNPPIILLDEPSTGMDPEARRFMWAVIYKISRRSKMSSVILTTHSMEEAETLCRRIGIMVDGEFKCIGTNQYLKDTYGDSFEISYIIKNMKKDEFENIRKDAFETAFDNNKKNEVKEFDNLIEFDIALKVLNKMNKPEIYKKLVKNFIFDEDEEMVRKIK